MNSRMKSLEDITTIVRKVNEKDAQAYKYLYDRYYIALCAYSSQMISSEEEVEDLVQEVFVAVYAGEHNFFDIRELTNYLYKSCYNKCISFIRSHQLHDELLTAFAKKQIEEQDDEAIYAKTIREELIRQLYVYIEELPEEQKRIMLLRIEGLEWGQIAQQLGISINTVKTQRMRSYKYLRERMGGSNFSVLLLFF